MKGRCRFENGARTALSASFYPQGKLRADKAVRAPFRAILLLLLLFVAAAVLSGCATTDSDELSARPWNTPKSWENGLPSGMMEGR